MSLILDALNKSEHERPDNKAVPGLQNIHKAEETGKSGQWKTFVWPLVALIFALAAVAGWLLRPPQMPVSVPPESAQQRVPTPAAAPVKSPEIVPVEAKVASTPVSAPAQQPAGSANVAALYAPTATPAPASAEPGLVPVQDVPAPAYDVEALARAARQALAERPVAEAPMAESQAPLISDLNQNIKDEIPTLYFSAHRWNSMPGNSEVVLNGKTYREGDLVKPGLRLTEIRENSIVLDYRDTPFRLRSLNSWVNL
jgi:general secretion pathway protein B